MRGVITDAEVEKVQEFLWDREYYVASFLIREALELAFKDALKAERDKSECAA